MQTVNVLGYQKELRKKILQRGDGQMGWIGLCPKGLFSSPSIPIPHQLGVLAEGLWGGQ